MIVVTLSLICGTCGKKGHEVYLQWCGACAAAICPTCFPVVQDEQIRCAACIKSRRRTKIKESMERLGREVAEKREKAFWEAFMDGG